MIEKLNEEINEIIKEANKKIKNITKEADLNLFKSQFLNKKSRLYELKSEIKNIDNKQKKQFASIVQNASLQIENLIANQREIILKLRYETKTSDQVFEKIGKINPLLKTKFELESIFLSLGYEIVDGYEIENDEYNFGRLNLDKDHPAREMQDTFYVDDNMLLRTHATNMTSRMLEKNANKEVKIVSSGKVYRRDDDDATHSHQFMQIDGFWVTEKNKPNAANLETLITTLSTMIKKIFGEDREIRLRPSYFPFTSPSFEVDMSCTCEEGCNKCKGTKFIEILGCGMIHENVLKAAGYNINEFQGFAFGIGIERIAMLNLNIQDIRDFYNSETRFFLNSEEYNVDK